jgi:hypothetical protein
VIEVYGAHLEGFEDLGFHCVVLLFVCWYRIEERSDGVGLCFVMLVGSE